MLWVRKMSKGTAVSCDCISRYCNIAWSREHQEEAGRLFGDRFPFLEEDKPRASLEGGPHHPALDGLRRAPIPHQGHCRLILRAGKEAAQLGHLV